MITWNSSPHKIITSHLSALPPTCKYWSYSLRKMYHWPKIPFAGPQEYFVLSGPHTLLRPLYIFFFSLPSFNIIKSYSVPGLGHSSGGIQRHSLEELQSIRRAGQVDRYNSVGGVGGTGRVTSSILGTREGCLEERF